MAGFDPISTFAPMALSLFTNAPGSGYQRTAMKNLSDITGMESANYQQFMPQLLQMFSQQSQGTNPLINAQANQTAGQLQTGYNTAAAGLGSHLSNVGLNNSSFGNRAQASTALNYGQALAGNTLNEAQQQQQYQQQGLQGLMQLIMGQGSGAQSGAGMLNNYGNQQASSFGAGLNTLGGSDMWKSLMGLFGGGTTAQTAQPQTGYNVTGLPVITPSQSLATYQASMPWNEQLPAFAR